MIKKVIKSFRCSKFHNIRLANINCRRQIEKSPLTQIEISLSTGLDGEHWADYGDCDEPDGDRPDERVTRSGGWQDQDRRGIDFDGTWAASGVSADEGVRRAWTAGAGVTTAWQAEQPPLSDGFACQKLASSGAADFWLFQLVRYGVLEGMIHGLAVASSAVGGPGETLRDRETGLLFPPRDARALAQSILHWQLIRIFGAEWPRREQHPCGLGYGRKSSRRWFLSIRKQLRSLEPAALGFWHPNSRAPSAAALQEAWR
jgi:hypothetical protein